MLKCVRIENYKSIERLELPLGRINVMVGENGAGKSNILEAIALAGAAQARKLDNEFLSSRGIRVSGPQLMRSAFKAGMVREPIKVSVEIDGQHTVEYELTNDNEPYSAWENLTNTKFKDFDKTKDWLNRYIAALETDDDRVEFISQMKEQFSLAFSKGVSKGGEKGRKFAVKLELKESNRIENG